MNTPNLEYFYDGYHQNTYAVDKRLFMINGYSQVKHTFKKYYNADTVIFNLCLTKHFVNIKSYEGVLKSF